MKKISKLISLALSLTTLVSIGACGPQQIGEKIDESKTQLYVGLHQAGYGIAWFDKIKAGFEAKNPDIQLIGKPGTSAYEYNLKYNIAIGRAHV